MDHGRRMDHGNSRSVEYVPLANLLLMAVCVLAFLVSVTENRVTPYAGFLYRRGALYAPLLLKGQDFHRLVTAIFLHADAAHLMNNMIVQFAGGGIVERSLGHARYILLYLVSGIGGNLASVLMDWMQGSFAWSVGASGAVFGVTGALLFMILREARKKEVPAPAMRSLLIRAGLMTAWLLYSGWANPMVNQAAHVGGLICGFVLAAVLMPHGGDLSPLL